MIFFSFCLEKIAHSVCISLGQCCDLEIKIKIKVEKREMGKEERSVIR